MDMIIQSLQGMLSRKILEMKFDRDGCFIFVESLDDRDGLRRRRQQQRRRKREVEAPGQTAKAPPTSVVNRLYPLADPRAMTLALLHGKLARTKNDAHGALC
ncbi:hypothetical protein L1887_39293 [Cichorium endivia]|nr:hypothetical protein L1887_39293 [Cichorium endivia]